MLNVNDYSHAIKLPNKCKDADLCPFINSSESCEIGNTPRNCPIYIKLNPLCTATATMDCQRKFAVYKFKDGRVYVLYDCRRCQYRLKDRDKALKFFKNLNLDIIEGKDLENLIEEINAETKKNPKTSDECITDVIDFLANHLEKL